METAFLSPSNASILGIPAVIFSLLILGAGIGLFTYILARRLKPLFRAAPHAKFDRIPERLLNTFNYPHHRMPRYLTAGAIHITILVGFIILALRWITMVVLGFSETSYLPWHGGLPGSIYDILKHIAATVVLAACIVAMVRRGVMKPARYDVPERFGKSHTPEALLAVGLIAALMLADMVFDGSRLAFARQQGLEVAFVPPGTGTWITAGLLGWVSAEKLQSLHLGAYFSHQLIFFGFLCFLPFGRLFHLVTALPTLLAMKLNKGTVKPVRWGVPDDKLEELDSFGVKKFEDFTWKHMLDFMACADCGRCSDQCPANAVGRPLSPRFISLKCRDYMYKAYPLKGPAYAGEDLIGNVLEEDEIWSCTTCGACEEECPILIEYIDKMVDLRRGMVDEGLVPQSLQKPLKALEKRGNPYGKMEKKRAEWTKDLAFKVPVLDGKQTAETLYFVDSISSYDDRIQEIARATATILQAAGVNFGVLGPAEQDSAHEVRRFGEEMLFQDLRDKNTEAIIASGARRIVTADPHAFNALVHDYQNMPPVQHISQFLAELIGSGKLAFKPIEEGELLFTYHDPCYLGRHNNLYEAPRAVLDAIPGLQRVEMLKCRDRSFCCGGGGLMLFYEPIEETRMGKLRVEMAATAGANVMVTACPFCLVNIEDGIKTSGLEGKMQVMDLTELVQKQLKID